MRRCRRRESRIESDRTEETRVGGKGEVGGRRGNV